MLLLFNWCFWLVPFLLFLTRLNIVQYPQGQCFIDFFELIGLKSRRTTVEISPFIGNNLVHLLFLRELCRRVYVKNFLDWLFVRNVLHDMNNGLRRGLIMFSTVCDDLRLNCWNFPAILLLGRLKLERALLQINNIVFFHTLVCDLGIHGLDWTSLLQHSDDANSFCLAQCF